MVEDTQKEQTLGSENTEAEKTETETTAKEQAGKTFTEDDLNRIVKERLDRERKKYSDYNDLKAAKAKLDEIEKAKLSDEEKAKAKLDELNKQIEERDKILKDKALKDIYRGKIEQAIADGRMKLPKGKTIASLVARSKATEEGEIDADVEDLIGFFPPDEPTKAIGGGSQQAPAKSPDIQDQITALTKQASDPKTDPLTRKDLQDQILTLKMRAGGGGILKIA